MIKISTTALSLVIQEAVRLVNENGDEGAIVIVGSTTGFGGPLKLALPGVSKGALNVMTKQLAFALMPHRIGVN